MPTGPVVQVEGARELRATLKRAGDDLGDLKGVHDEIARLIAGVAATRAPKLTGRLAGSIRGSGAKTVATVRAGGASIPYAKVIHFGWPAHNISANPFLVNPAHDTEPVWTRYYLNAVNAILSKVKGI
jgi:hypothetical protein